MLPLSVSLVVYRTAPETLQPFFELLASCDLSEWTVVDNAASEDADQAQKMRNFVVSNGGRYLAPSRNIGFGAGHNMALASQAFPRAEFHLMVNPDVFFDCAVLTDLIGEMQARPEVGLIMPKVLYEDGTFQPVCKLLPTPADFALRRFAPNFVQGLFREKLARYEMVGVENKECAGVPFLSGCFLFARRSVLDAVQGFDERFFLYLEDVDLCRKIAQLATLLYWPQVSVVHGCVRGAYHSTKLMVLFIRSSMSYFNKWGWFFDEPRRTANRKALQCIRAES